MKKTLEEYILDLSIKQNLSKHTLKAYRIDISQIISYFNVNKISKFDEVTKSDINEYLLSLKESVKIKSLKRKSVSIKKFFNYLFDEGFISSNPFDRITLKFKSENQLPKIISFHDIKKIYSTVYSNYNNAGLEDVYSLTEVLIIELLYTTGIRVAELCNIKIKDINMNSKTILIHGKGRKERIVFVQNIELIYLIRKYLKLTYCENNQYFLKNKNKEKLSEQSVRLRIKRITDEAKIDKNITPHMFRHTFATSLLEEEVNLMYIQDLLGHSSLSTTQIYITINKKKQQRLLSRKHPRNKITTSL